MKRTRIVKTGEMTMFVLFGRIWVSRYGVYMGHKKKGYYFPGGGALLRLVPFRREP